MEYWSIETRCSVSVFLPSDIITPSLVPGWRLPMSACDNLPAGWFRRCGASGLKLPAISLGCWHNFGGAGTDAQGMTDDAAFHENCRRMLFTAFDLGVTHFDLANNYGPPPGSAEERVGRMLNRGPERDVFPVTARLGLGVICFSPLRQGLLSDRYLSGIPSDSRAASEHGFLRRNAITPELLENLRLLNQLATERGQSLAQM